MSPGPFFIGLARIFERSGKVAFQFFCGCIKGPGMDFPCAGHKGVRGLDWLCRK